MEAYQSHAGTATVHPPGHQQHRFAPEPDSAGTAAITGLESILAASPCTAHYSMMHTAPAESQCAKVLVDGSQQCLCTWQPQWHVSHIKVLHVVGALKVLQNIALASAAQKTGGRHTVNFVSCKGNLSSS